MNFAICTLFCCTKYTSRIFFKMDNPELKLPNETIFKDHCYVTNFIFHLSINALLSYAKVSECINGTKIFDVSPEYLQILLIV